MFQRPALADSIRQLARILAESSPQDVDATRFALHDLNTSITRTLDNIETLDARAQWTLDHLNAPTLPHSLSRSAP